MEIVVLYLSLLCLSIFDAKALIVEVLSVVVIRYYMNLDNIPKIIKETTALSRASWAATIGSQGNNIIAKRMLGEFDRIYVVEDDATKCCRLRVEFDHLASFCLVDGNAQQTFLPDQSIDIILASSIISPRDWLSAIGEFHRTLRPPGWLAFININLYVANCGNSPRLKNRWHIQTNSSATLEMSNLIFPRLLCRDNGFTRFVFYDNITVDQHSTPVPAGWAGKPSRSAPDELKVLTTNTNQVPANSNQQAAKTIDVVVELYLGQVSWLMH